MTLQWFTEARNLPPGKLHIWLRDGLVYQNREWAWAKLQHCSLLHCFPGLRSLLDLLTPYRLFRMSEITTCESMQQKIWFKVEHYEAASSMACSTVQDIDDLKHNVLDRNRYTYQVFIEGHHLRPIDRIPTDTRYERPIHFRLIKRSTRE